MRELALSNDEALVQVFNMEAEAMQATAPKAISTQLKQIPQLIASKRIGLQYQIQDLQIQHPNTLSIIEPV